MTTGSTGSTGDRRSRRPVGAGGLPWWVFGPAALGAAFVLLPLVALLLRGGLGGFATLVTTESARDALWLSLRTAAASTLLCLVLGVPLALVLARACFPGQRLLRALVLLPLVLPPVVGGLALLYALGRQGLLGGTLQAFGVGIPFTTLAVVLAQAFVAMPFLVSSLEGALRSAGDGHALVAAGLGAPPGTVLFRVTLPLVAPGLLAGCVLAFARSLGEFGATIVFAGSLQGVTRTIPLEVYLAREVDPDAAVALALVLVVVAAAVIGLVQQRPEAA